MTKKNRKHSAGIVLRDILLALLLVAVVAASAILVYRRFFESGPATPDEKQNIAKNHYDADSFYEENGMLRYAKSAHLTGVDVSEHQEKIDWAAVRAAGVDFAILRIGYRGYTEGSLREDSWFAENYTAARAAGVQLGVYFFSQATTLEEARADLFGLYYLGDPKLVELGLIPSLDVAKAGYAKYILNGMMTQLARIEPGKNVEESHMRNRKLICEWCYERGKAGNVIELVKENGKTYAVVNDFGKLRELFGEMLREVQRIKSEGDYEAGKALVERYAVTVDPELHEEVRDRYYALSIEPYGGFVNPEYELVEKDGRIVDVKISYPANYVEQMLGYSKNYSFLPNIN